MFDFMLGLSYSNFVLKVICSFDTKMCILILDSLVIYVHLITEFNQIIAESELDLASDFNAIDDGTSW